MEHASKSKHHYFYAVGISYKKADTVMRGKFSLDVVSRQAILDQAIENNIESLIVTSTCNRTEIYGFAEHPYQLIKLICQNSNGTADEFQEYGFVFKNHDAINHMFRVGTGLDSQILGDFEIISQIKTACTESRAFSLMNTFMDRLTSAVIIASKKIKNETQISTGATSVSFASVQYIMRNVVDISNKNLLLFGTGKIGRNTCENLVKHTKNEHITLINRTKDKAEKIAGKLNLIVKDYSELHLELRNADVLVVATGAQMPTVDKTILNLNKPLLILDLSIPKNVNENVTDLPGVTLIHIDHLSQMTDDTLENRKLEIPAAEAIINDVKNEFLIWMKARKFAPTIHALKEKLNAIKMSELDFQSKKMLDYNQAQAEIISNRLIQKITSQFANHLKDDATLVDESIEWIEKVFQIQTTAKV